LLGEGVLRCGIVKLFEPVENKPMLMALHG